MLSADPSVLDKIQRWVFSLSSTTFRPFRHTATAISLGFITTLCEIYAKLNKAHDTSNAALEKEKKSKKSARIKELERAAEEQENQIQTLTELMQSTYDRFGSLVKWLMVVFLFIGSGMLIIGLGRNVFMNLDSGCRNSRKYTLTQLTYDTSAGQSLTLYFPLRLLLIVERGDTT